MGFDEGVDAGEVGKLPARERRNGAILDRGRRFEPVLETPPDLLLPTLRTQFGLTILRPCTLTDGGIECLRVRMIRRGLANGAVIGMLNRLPGMAQRMIGMRMMGGGKLWIRLSVLRVMMRPGRPCVAGRFVMILPFEVREVDRYPEPLQTPNKQRCKV
jgi:hypothetical protein